MRRIRAVTLDLDETMLDRRVTFEGFLRRQMRRFAHFFDHVDHDSYFARVLELDRDGDTPKPEVFAVAVREFAIVADAALTLAEDFDSVFPDEAVVFPGLVEVLDALRAQSYRLAIITNGTSSIQRRKIDRMGLDTAFQHIAISEEEGCKKPDPEIFRRTLDRLGVRPDQAVHVGDNPRADITGAKDAGLHAIWTRSRRWAQPLDADAIIEDISELPAALQRHFS